MAIDTKKKKKGLVKRKKQEQKRQERKRPPGEFKAFRRRGPPRHVKPPKEPKVKKASRQKAIPKEKTPKHVPGIQSRIGKKFNQVVAKEVNKFGKDVGKAVVQEVKYGVEDGLNALHVGTLLGIPGLSIVTRPLAGVIGGAVGIIANDVIQHGQEYVDTLARNLPDRPHDDEFEFHEFL